MTWIVNSLSFSIIAILWSTDNATMLIFVSSRKVLNPVDNHSNEPHHKDGSQLNIITASLGSNQLPYDSLGSVGSSTTLCANWGVFPISLYLTFGFNVLRAMVEGLSQPLQHKYELKGTVTFLYFWYMMILFCPSWRATETFLLIYSSTLILSASQNYFHQILIISVDSHINTYVLCRRVVRTEPRWPLEARSWNLEISEL